MNTTIVIRTGDNDFGNTFQPMIAALVELVKFKGGDVTESDIRQFFKDTVVGYYRAFQFENETPERFAKTISYLERLVSDVDVFVNESATDWLVGKQPGDDNWATYVAIHTPYTAVYGPYTDTQIIVY